MKAIRVENAATSARLGWRIDAKSDVADIEIYDQIGQDFFGDGLDAADFVRDIRALNVGQINLHVNSPGGLVDDSKAIYHALQSHAATVHAYIEGVAASAASFIIMAADEISIAPHARIQIHDAHAGIAVMTTANAADVDLLIAELRNVRNVLDEESTDISQIYEARSGVAASDWRKRMQANGSLGTSYRGSEAVEAGLADSVYEPSEKKVNRPARNGPPVRVAAQATPSPPSPEPEDDIDLALIPPLANGYKPPLPADFTRLVAANLPASKKEPRNGN